MRVGLRFDLRMYFVQLSSFPAGGSNSATSVPAALLANTQRTQSCEPTGFGCVKTISSGEIREQNQDRRVRFKIVGRGVSPWSRSLGDPTLGQEASVVGKSAFPGKVKVRETAGRKVCVMTCGVTSVG